MQIQNVKLTNLRNEEHFQFQSEFNDLVVQYTPEMLGIEAAYLTYLPLYSNEAEALNVIRKSAVTNEIGDADNKRDNTYRGFCDTIKGATRHFVPKKKEAADRIQIVLDRFGNINTKTYDEETAAINSLTDNLANDYAADLVLLKVADWVAELNANNEAFEALMDERYSDDAGKTQLKMKDVRKEVDEAYRAITTRIDALAIVNGAETYAPFVNELNQRIEKFNLTIAQRKGRNNKKDTD